jgi:tRNA G10  N-methylase Trm11
MELYNNGEPFDCDMTASSLAFYRQTKGDEYSIPTPKILFDVAPQVEGCQKIEPYKPLPLDDESIGSIVIDLPFIISSMDAPSKDKDGANKIMNRFASFYPVDLLYYNYAFWIKDAYRVLKPDGFVVFKTQSVISGGIRINTEAYSFMCAMYNGFTIEDQFTLVAKNRLISPSKYKKQMHARSYTSQFFVFKKTMKKKSKDFNYWNIIPKIEEHITELSDEKLIKDL